MADDDPVEWHGWRVSEGVQLHIGKIPAREQIALYILEGSVLSPLAFFPTERRAKKAQAILDGWVDRMNALERERTSRG